MHKMIIDFYGKVGALYFGTRLSKLAKRFVFWWECATEKPLKSIIKHCYCDPTLVMHIMFFLLTCITIYV